MEEPMKEPVKAKAVKRIHCGNCDGDAYICNNCGDYFDEDREIICLGSEHFCNMECYNVWKRKEGG